MGKDKNSDGGNAIKKLLVRVRLMMGSWSLAARYACFCSFVMTDQVDQDGDKDMSLK
jgi:hypothetical protein